MIGNDDMIGEPRRIFSIAFSNFTYMFSAPDLNLLANNSGTMS